MPGAHEAPSGGDIRIIMLCVCGVTLLLPLETAPAPPITSGPGPSQRAVQAAMMSIQCHFRRAGGAHLPSVPSPAWKSSAESKVHTPLSPLSLPYRLLGSSPPGGQPQLVCAAF